MDKFDKLTAVAAPLPHVNIDTDAIIPKQFLKTIKRTGLGKNLFAVDEARDLRRGIGAGAGLFLGNFHLEAEYRGDYRHSITRLIGSGEDAQSETLLPGDFGHGVAVGAEYVVAQVPLRLGFSRLPFDDNRISAGLGYRSSVFGLDAAFEQNLSNSDDRVISFSFSGQF